MNVLRLPRLGQFLNVALPDNGPKIHSSGTPPLASSYEPAHGSRSIQLQTETVQQFCERRLRTSSQCRLQVARFALLTNHRSTQ